MNRFANWEQAHQKLTEIDRKIDVSRERYANAASEFDLKFHEVELSLLIKRRSDIMRQWIKDSSVKEDI